MSVKEITVEYGYTKNLGNYESERMTASATVTVEKGNRVEDLYNESYLELQHFVHEKLGLTKVEKEEQKYELNNQDAPRRRRI